MRPLCLGRTRRRFPTRSLSTVAGGLLSALNFQTPSSHSDQMFVDHKTWAPPGPPPGPRIFLWRLAGPVFGGVAAPLLAGRPLCPAAGTLVLFAGVLWAAGGSRRPPLPPPPPRPVFAAGCALTPDDGAAPDDGPCTPLSPPPPQAADSWPVIR